MKHIIKRISLASALLLTSVITQAQSTPEGEIDTLESVNLVQNAFRKVAGEDVLGSVSVVNVEELMEKSYILSSLDNMEALAPGWNGTSLWGMDNDNSASYLVLIDGSPRDANTIMPSEIESITFMKGASAVVLYGSAATKGVIYITSKRGKIEDLKVTANVNTGIHFIKRMPEYLCSAEYMTLYNEALANDGLDALYSTEDIYNYGSGNNPYRYADVDMYSTDYVSRAYNRTDASLQITGGTKVARYYTNIGYLREGDALNFGEADNNGTNRLNVRGNVDFEISDKISSYVNASASLYDYSSANGDYWTAANTWRPNRVSPLIPLSYINEYASSALSMIQSSENIIDGAYLLGGSLTDQTNLIADFYAAGNSKSISRQFQFDTGLNIDLSSIAQGLSFGGQFAVDYATSYTTSYNNQYAVYSPIWSNLNGYDEIVGLEQYGVDEHSGVQNVSNSYEKQTISAMVNLSYAHTFDKNHNVTAMLLANGFQQSITQLYHRPSYANLGAQATYNFNHRYYVDAALAYVHSSKFAEGNRGAFSPSVSLGWNLSKEKFMSGVSFVDDLMLSASASVLNSDLDINDYYMYNDNYTNTGDIYYSWADGGGEQATYSLVGGNSDLTYTKRKELSFNLRGSLFEGRISTDLSFYTALTEGSVVQPTTIYPNYFTSYYPVSTFIPYVNYNNSSRHGFDFSINYNTNINQVGLSVGVVGSYYDTEATRRDESYEYEYQNRTGQAVDAMWGLVSDGFYEDYADINSSPTSSFGDVAPGDIKYIDQNGDNIIDSNDEVVIGKWGSYGSPMTLGVNITARWNNFTLFVLGTSSFGSQGMKNNSYYWVSGDSKYSAVVRDRWTEETADTATYPRLSTTSSDNNFRSSDFWIYDNNRFDLSKVQLTYDISQEQLGSKLLSNLSLYVAGYNLLTIAKEKELFETNYYGAPYTRFVNFGVKATF
ncbi:MAG: SusC/RagA family TonB-linked outer membrane protein [Rikenellaceae bacterium]